MPITRSAPVAHRTGLSAVDKLAAPTLVTSADVATLGLLLPNTSYKAAIAPWNRWGVTLPSNILTQATADDSNSTHSVRVTIPQVAGAEGYDLFLSTDAAPKYVARITEAQRAAGCRILTDHGVGVGENASDIGALIRTALAADSDVGGFFTITGSGATAIATAKTKAANDATLNIALANGTAAGLTAAPTSANTTPGVAPVLQVETATVAGTVTVGVPQVETATIVGTITPGTNQVETATIAGAITTGVQQVETSTVVGTVTPGTAQVETLVVVEDVPGVLTAGNATITVTAAGMPGSPKAVVVALALNDTVNQVATKFRTALTADNDVASFFTIGGTNANVTLTARVAAANDSTMNAAYADTTSAGLTDDATSDDTTAGVAIGTGYAIVIVTAAGMGNSPKAIHVNVIGADAASTVATKIRTALAADTDVSAFFTVGGTGADVALTTALKSANDATMNIDIDNGTCTGLTDAPTSANTTAGVATGAGNATITVTASGLTGSPKSISVAVADSDTASQVAGKVRTALAADTAVTALFTVSGATDAVILAKIAKAANDATLNIASTNGTCTGLTPAATSANTTPGVAAGTGNASIVVTASGMGNTPKTISVAVVAADTASQVAGKVRTALAGDTDVNTFFSVGGTGADVALTRLAAAANDGTMNIASDNGTSTGLTTEASSANTTAGVAAGTGNATVIVTASGMTGSPETVTVAVVAGDTAAAIAGKIRTALAANAHVGAFFTVSGTTTGVILTVKAAAANDGTLNIDVDNGTSTGITTAHTSANTTAGVAGTAQVETATAAGNISSPGNLTVIVTAAGMTNSPKTVSVAVTGAAGVAGAVDIGAAGTGVQTNAIPFTASTAYTPGTGDSPVDLQGHAYAYVNVKVRPIDLRSAPTLTIAYFLKSGTSGDYYYAGSQAVPLGGALLQPFEQTFKVAVDGAAGIFVCIDTVTGSVLVDISIEPAG